jgi:hypothetical protein
MRTGGLGSLLVLVAVLSAGCGGGSRATSRASSEAAVEARTIVAEPEEEEISFRDADVAVVLRGIRDQLASCVPFSTEPFLIEIILMPDGRLVRDDAGMMAQHIATCLDETLAAAHMPRSVRLGRTISLDVAEVWRSP